jgi:hypothetical protein
LRPIESANSILQAIPTRWPRFQLEKIPTQWPSFGLGGIPAAPTTSKMDFQPTLQVGDTLRP